MTSSMPLIIALKRSCYFFALARHSHGGNLGLSGKRAFRTALLSGGS